MKNCSTFRRIRTVGYCGFLRRDQEGSLLIRAQEIPDDPEARLCKDRPKIKAAVLAGLFVKRYNLPGFWNQFRTLFRTPRPFTALHAAEAIAACGVRTPAVLAAFRCGAFLPHRDYLVTEALPDDAVSGRELFSRIPVQELEKELLQEVLPVVAALHGAGIEQGDLNWRNLYRLRDRSWGVLDLDGCRIFNKPLSAARRRKELARLVSSFLLASGRQDPGLAERWSSAYRQFSGVDVSGPAYEKRIAFLRKRYPGKETHGNL